MVWSCLIDAGRFFVIDSPRLGACVPSSVASLSRQVYVCKKIDDDDDDVSDEGVVAL
jgi:hypothetical protein